MLKSICLIMVLCVTVPVMATDLALVTTYLNHPTGGGNVELWTTSGSGWGTTYTSKALVSTTGQFSKRGSNPYLNAATGKYEVVTISYTDMGDEENSNFVWYADRWQVASDFSGLTKIGTSTLAAPAGYPDKNTAAWVESQVSFGKITDNGPMGVVFSSGTWHGAWDVTTGANLATFQQGWYVGTSAGMTEPWYKYPTAMEYGFISGGGSLGAVTHMEIYQSGPGTYAIARISDRPADGTTMGNGFNAKDLDGDGVIDWLAASANNTGVMVKGIYDDITNPNQLTAVLPEASWNTAYSMSNIVLADGLAYFYTPNWGSNYLRSFAFDPATGTFKGPSDGMLGHMWANGTIADVSLMIVPEPATLMMLGLGGVALIRRRK